jgi:hypothetical protein
MKAYNKEIYSQKFARLLNRAMKQGAGDPQKALTWLDKNYKPLVALFFTRHKLETSDAYMDVREHIVERIRNDGSQPPD